MRQGKAGARFAGVMFVGLMWGCSGTTGDDTSSSSSSSSSSGMGGSSGVVGSSSAGGGSTGGPVSSSRAASSNTGSSMMGGSSSTMVASSSAMAGSSGVMVSSSAMGGSSGITGSSSGSMGSSTGTTACPATTPVRCSDGRCVASTTECVLGGNEAACDDTQDNDQDQLIDCQDPDCRASNVCAGIQRETNCTNNVDDDNDNLIDCRDADCATAASCAQPTFELLCANMLDDDNDGAVDCRDPDCANNSACANVPREVLCADRVDNDMDSLVDCLDVDCANAPGCQVLPPEARCSDQQDNDNDGLTDCRDPDCSLSGECGNVAVERACGDNADNDNDGFVDCRDSDCFVSPDCNGGTTETECADQRDNDGDNRVDCQDPDCRTTPACSQTQPETACTDRTDNDNDGLVDCTDPDCRQDNACTMVQRETACTDGRDNDNDGLVDCRDPDCANDPRCQTLPETACADMLDNDNDGRVDCADLDCFTTPACNNLPRETACDDGMDNDNDGFIDCRDPDCAGAMTCGGFQTELLCGDNVDNDNDGLVDCGDPDCARAQQCQGIPTETRCADGVDNDGDNRVDCQDPDCSQDPLCQQCPPGTIRCTSGACVRDAAECGVATCLPPAVRCPNGTCVMDVQACFGMPTETVCDDQRDNDGDNRVDCQDPDCANANNCGNSCPATIPVRCQNGMCVASLQECLGRELNCDDQVDNDQDQATDCQDTDCAQTPVCVACPTDRPVRCQTGECVAQADQCLGTREVDCTDMRDNDADTRVDCQDPDCAFDVACQQACPMDRPFRCPDNTCAASQTGCMQREFSCTDREDNDNDQLVDCVDPDCDLDPSCFAGCPMDRPIRCQDNTCVTTFDQCLGGRELNCTDGQDNDNDQRVDCADSDCAFDQSCGMLCPPDRPFRCLDNVCVASLTQCLPGRETNCTDQEDNDNDQRTDCQDSDCAQDPACQMACPATRPVRCPDGNCVTDFAQCVGGGVERVCNDQQDNDGDMRVDCQDLDCALDPACGQMCPTDAPVRCQDGRCVRDLAECFAGGVELLCSDQRDNDGDNRVDCEDQDCFTDQACGGNGCPPGTFYCPLNGACVTTQDACGGQDRETLCGDLRDNDLDQRTDCEDPDCALAPECRICPVGTVLCPTTGECVVDPVQCGGLGGRETLCSDQRDNDADGRVDCADEDCAFTAACGVCPPEFPVMCLDGSCRRLATECGR